jgi:hypothetical protein
MLQNIHGWFSYHSAWRNNLRIINNDSRNMNIFPCLTRKEIKNRLSHILHLDYLHEFNNYNIKNSKQIFVKWIDISISIVLCCQCCPFRHCFHVCVFVFASHSVIHQFTAFLQLITAAYGWYRTIRTNTEGTIYCNSIRQNTITIVLQ